MVVAEQKAAGGVGPHRPAGGVDGEIDSLGGGEAVGLFGDVPAERLGVPVLDDHEEGDVAVLNGWDHRRVRAPHHAGRVGGDSSIVVVGRPLRAAVRREQSILAHEAQHPVPADADAIEGAQAGPDLAVPLAGIEAARTEVARAASVGVIGYCWGGFLTWISATRLQGFSAAVSYYGGGIGSVAEGPPKCPVLMHFGERDHAIPLACEQGSCRPSARGRDPPLPLRPRL